MNQPLSRKTDQQLAYLKGAIQLAENAESSFQLRRNEQLAFLQFEVTLEWLTKELFQVGNFDDLFEARLKKGYFRGACDRLDASVKSPDVLDKQTFDVLQLLAELEEDQTSWLARCIVKSEQVHAVGQSSAVAKTKAGTDIASELLSEAKTEQQSPLASNLIATSNDATSETVVDNNDSGIELLTQACAELSTLLSRIRSLNAEY